MITSVETAKIDIETRTIASNSTKSSHRTCEGREKTWLGREYQKTKINGNQSPKFGFSGATNSEGRDRDSL